MAQRPRPDPAERRGPPMKAQVAPAGAAAAAEDDIDDNSSENGDWAV